MPRGRSGFKLDAIGAASVSRDVRRIVRGMTHDELIAKARDHLKPFERMGAYPVRSDDYPEVRVRETVVVYFSRKDRDDSMEVCLDSESGEFVAGTYIPPKDAQNATGEET